MIHALAKNSVSFNQESFSGAQTYLLLQRLLAALFFVAFFVGMYILFHSTALPIRKVKISGQFVYLSPNELQSIVIDAIQANFFKLKLGIIHEKLLTEPLVYDAQVQRVWPDTIHVTVVEQTAVARWRDTGLLNLQGVLFPQKSTALSSALPHLYGPDGLEKKVLDRYTKANRIISPSGYHITSFSLNARRSWEFQLASGMRVILGKNDFHQRLERFSVWALTALAGQLSDIEYIDLRYPSGFAVKWAQQHNLVVHSDKKNR